MFAVKVRENRLEILRRLQPDRWYNRAELQDVEFFLLQRMAQEGLLESKFVSQTSSFKYRNVWYVKALKELTDNKERE
jgi:hypothetical protein